MNKISKRVVRLWSDLRWLREMAIEDLQKKVPGLEIEEVSVKKVYFTPHYPDSFLPEEILGESLNECDVMINIKIKALLSNVPSKGKVINQLLQYGKLTLMDNTGCSLKAGTYRATYVREFGFEVESIKNLYLEDGPIDIEVSCGDEDE